MLGLGLSLTTRAVLGAGGFSPRSLFAAGEVGAWYDPSDLTTLYQDTAGTTPVTEAGQRVALMLDKSRGLALGPELVAAGWTADAGWAQNGQTFTATAAAVNTEVEISGLVSANKTYQVQITWSGLTSGSSFRFYLFQFVGAFDIGAVADGASGSRTYRVAAPSSGAITALRSLGAGSNGTFTLSIRELPGNHATQSVLAQRPTYAVEPVTGRRNLLTYTEQFDNAAWSKGNITIAANSATAPNGEVAADSYVLTAGTLVRELNRSPSAAVLSSSTAYTFSCYLKDGGDGSGWYEFTQASGVLGRSWFNPRTGTKGTGAGAITAVGSGWYRCDFPFTTGGSAASTVIYISARSADGGTGAETGAGGVGAYIWGAQLELGSTATAYQRVVTAQDVSEAGVAARPYLFFDGIDDGLVTGTITPGADKVAVFAGVRKLSDVQSTLVEHSPSASSNSGSFAIFAPNLSPNYFFRSRGTANGDATTPDFTNAPITNVITGLGDISGDSAAIRVDGVSKNIVTSDQGTGNYLAYPLYIGRRGGTSLPFSGHIYGMIVRFSAANLAAASIAATERWMNSKTGAF
jgi:hypothetical protein